MIGITTVLFVLTILFGSYTGIRYLGAFFHYACTAPGADCPPPFRLAGQFAWYTTGGTLVPFWTRN